MVDPLFQKWRAYEKLVENDYMGHARFFRRLEEEVKSRFERPVAILDLGCGDVSPIRNVLERLEVERYSGVDDAVTALAKARASLGALGIPYDLYSGDLLDVLQGLPERRYEVIVASYALHHMMTAETKERVLQECHRVLRSDGAVFVIDVFLREGESRDAYLHRWESNARTTFTALNSHEMTILIDHVWSCDFPESLSTYEEIGTRAGYERITCLTEDALNNLVELVPSK